MKKLEWRNIMISKRPLLLGVIFAIAGAFIYAQMTAAATYTWDNGDGDGLWSTCANWSSDVCPGSGDVATFDGSTTTDAVIDTSFAGSVSGIDINSGYTGTITQQRNLSIGNTGFNQADGTFKQGTTTFTITAAGFVLSAGVFETGVGTSAMERDMTLSGGSYIASSTSVVKFNPNHTAEDPTLTCTGAIDGLIDIAGRTNGGSVFTLAAGCEATTTDSTVHNASITNDGILHFGTNVDFNTYALNFINNGTTTFAGTDLYTEGSITQNGVFDLTGKTIHFNPNHSFEDPTLACNGTLGGLINIAGRLNGGSVFTLAAGCEATTTDSTVHNASLTNNGILHFGTNVDFNSYSINFINNGTTTFAGTDLYTEGSITQNGVFDLTGKTIHFNPDHNFEDPTLSCALPLGGLIRIVSTGGSGSIFTLATGCSSSATTSSGTGTLIIDGTLTSTGETLSGDSITISNGGTLRLQNSETVTSPVLSTGSTIEYYGASTYTTVGDYSYKNLLFSAGTYNLTSDLSVAGDFTNSGATFNQTSGTTTFTGTANTIAGNNTFYNLEKSATAASSLTFTAGDTQTVTGTLTLSGLDGSNRLTLQSSSGGSQWYLDPQGTRILDFLTISDGNNSNVAFVNCYDVDCTDGGNNTSIYFTEPLPTYRFRGGVRLHGGTRI